MLRYTPATADMSSSASTIATYASPSLVVPMVGTYSTVPEGTAAGTMVMRAPCTPSDTMKRSPPEGRRVT